MQSSIPVEAERYFLETLGVSRETIEAFKVFDRLFLDYATHHNIVARSTLEDRWDRHFIDSAQLYPLCKDAPRLHVDIGSGGGFPGLVLALLFHFEKPSGNTQSVLVESTGKKCVFLRQVCRELGLKNTKVENCRVESLPGFNVEVDLITARALAPLDKLFDLTGLFWRPGTCALFMKGERFQEEIDAAKLKWHFSCVSYESVTSGKAQILEIRDVLRV